MEPFLKAVGGKRWLSTKLAAEIKAIDPMLYVEPFVGGGAVTFALDPRIQKIVSDTNSAFITVWQSIKSLPYEEVHAAWETVQRRYPNTGFGYAQARDAFNARPDRAEARASAELAALVMYLNFRSFNGLWRVNKDGRFNVPWRKQDKARVFTLREFQDYRAVLSNVEAKAQDFRPVLDSLLSLVSPSKGKHSAVYADPPYDGTFGAYTSDSFDDVDQRDLGRWLRYLSMYGVRIWTTNADTPLVREIYSWAKIETIEEYHSVGAKTDRRGQRKCLLIRSH